MKQRQRVLVKAPILTQSGYGEHGRLVLRALRSQENIFDIYLHALEWGHTSWHWEDTEERAWIDGLLQKTIHYLHNGGQFDMSLQVTIPGEWEKIAPINIGVTAGIETDLCSAEWLSKTGVVDKIITISEHARDVFLNSLHTVSDPETGMPVELKCEAPVDIVHYPVRQFDPGEIDLNLTTDFNFLSIVQWGPRKNIENMVSWFVDAFKNRENVGLILKTNLAKNCLLDRRTVTNKLQNLLNKFPDRKCKVYLLHGYLKDEEMSALYQHDKVKALISLTHGEGFGLPMFEAAYYGLPIVATDWSGQKDFLYMPVADKKGKIKNKAMFSRVDFTLEKVQQHAVWAGVVEAESKWAFPKETSFKKNIKQICDDHGRHVKRAKDLQKHLCENFSEAKQYSKFVNYVLGRRDIAPEPVTGISFCISTNGAKLEKTQRTVNSIHKTMSAATVPYEIIVAGPADILKKDKKVTYVEAKQQADSGQLALLRNMAAEKSNKKNNVIVFADDDLIFDKNWAPRLQDYSKSTGWEVLGNRILLPDGGRYWDRATAKPHVMIDYDDYAFPGQAQYQTGCFWIIRSDVFAKEQWDSKIEFYAEKNGGINEDVEYSLRLQRQGVALSFDKENLVWHDDDSYVECFKDNPFVPGSACLKKDYLAEEYELEFFPSECADFLKAKEAAR
tara:strand:- start:8923 stop:10941 length:2019 start_codon:yes stop_codon:yes gene_type:complete